MRTDHSLRWSAAITPEKVDRARRDLDLGETATAAQIIRCYRELARQWHPDVCRDAELLTARERFRQITQAKTLLMELIRIYRCSFLSEDIRRDQLDPLEQHRRQFANDPVWAGGEYDDPSQR